MPPQVWCRSTLILPVNLLAGEYVAPFLRVGPTFATDGYPQFDLDQWNPDYFERLHGFLSAAQERDIIIELTLFSCSYADAVWRLNPLNIQNNINGVGDIPWQNYISMRDDALFERQLAYVRKIVQEVNQYDNFYFEVCNEPLVARAGFTPLDDFASTEEIDDWQRVIRNTIRDEENRLPKQHLIFQVPVEEWRTDTALERILNEESVDAVNMHDYQNLTYKEIMLPSFSRFMQRDLRLKRINHFWTTVHETEKPFIFDEDNAATNALDEEAWIVHRKRAWTTVCSGGHYNMIDFSIQVGGQEAGTPASQATIRSWLKHLSVFIHGIDFVQTTPVANFATETPPFTIAIALVNPGQEYVIYLADQREVDHVALGEPCQGSLVFSLPEGTYTAQLYSPVDGQYKKEPITLSGGAVALDLKPFIHDLVVHIQSV